ncbi:MAG TPA: histidinol dehydrogenase, partial [Acidimicrobiales bacterium]|nr:histidinol dehydrogenase [Acidimicrobiales bacterium]
MLRRIDLRGRTPGTREVRGLLPRAPIDVESAVEKVRPICADVRDRGAVAVREITKRFDGVELTALRVDARAIEKALADLDPGVRSALEEATKRARAVHRAQLRDDVRVDVADGAVVTERFVPVRRVGLYVPGGLVAYPSSVVMNVVPAQEA